MKKRMKEQKNRICKKNGVNGYFTVEASLLLPAVILLIVFLFYLAFFLYNRCVLTQDAYVLAFRGSLWCERDGAAVRESVEEEIRRQSAAKYVGLGTLKRSADADGKQVSVTVQGGMRVPKQWRLSLESRARRICPVRRIRRFRLIKKTVEAAEQAAGENHT